MCHVREREREQIQDFEAQIIYNISPKGFIYVHLLTN